MTGVDADNVHRSRFPRYLHHLCGTTRRVAHGLAVPQCIKVVFLAPRVRAISSTQLFPRSQGSMPLPSAFVSLSLTPPWQDDQLMPECRILCFKPALRLAWRGQHGQHETQQRDPGALTLSNSFG